MKPFYLDKYPHVFDPLTVRRGANDFTFKNRILLGPMGCTASGGGADSDGRINNYGLDFYTRVVRDGVASVCLTMEVPRDGAHPGSFNLNTEHLTFMNFHLLQRSVHAHNSLTFMEIENAGPATVKPGLPRLGAVDYVCNGKPVRAMTEADMEQHVQLYAEAAALARRANFDGLLLHFAHGYLIHQFLTPLLNRRTDAYGGSVENRCRFPMRVLKAIREAVGDDMLIELRLSGSDDLYAPVDGLWGVTPEDAAEQVLILQEYADMIHINGGGTRTTSGDRGKSCGVYMYDLAPFTRFSTVVKHTPGVRIPIGVVTGVNSVALAEQVLADEKADYVVMARAVVADNEVVKKAREGREDDIRPCIRCNYCMDYGRRKALGNALAMSDSATFNRVCSVNPLHAQGASKRRFAPADRVKQIAVIGGGVAGMQAALSAAERGHQVTLFEQTDRLGGQALLSDVMPFKQDMKAFHEYLERQVKKCANITLRLSTAATRELIDSLDPDAVIVAVGAEQVIPPIPGVEKAIPAFDVFGHEQRLGQRVAIIGGGTIGGELSVHLSRLGRECIVVELADAIAAQAELSARSGILDFMQQSRVECLTSTRCTEITDDGLWVENAGGRQFIPADSVVVCVGTRPRAAERDQFKNVAFDVINVGDCKRASNILHAVTSGWDAGAIL